MSPNPAANSDPHPARKVGVTVALSVLLFLCFELALQIRSHIRYGQSVLNAFTEETRYVTHPESHLRTLRPNHVFRAKHVEIKTNHLGLRSAPVTTAKAPGTFRIAVIGASTVMGAYAASNEDTFSYKLESLLNGTQSSATFEVINGGIAGYGLDDQRQLIEKVIQPLGPDLIIVYPGFNDFADYCRADQEVSRNAAAQRSGLPLMQAPSWLLSVDLIQKNTVQLRTPPSSRDSFKSVNGLDISGYRNRLDALIKTAKLTGAHMVIATNARAYRREQPIDEQISLSETARYYNPCFDLASLHDLYDLHNQEIINAASRHEIDLVPLGNLIPGGREYFADASHFSNRGEQTVAESLYRYLVTHTLVPRH